MLVKKINAKQVSTRIPVVFWLNTKHENYKISGDLRGVEKWISANIDKSLPYVYHIYFFRKPMTYDSNANFRASHGFCKDINHNIVDVSDENLYSICGVWHPVVNLSIIPHEKYFNYLVKGDSSLEYTVNCYNKKQKYALVQNRLHSNKDIHKLIAVFNKIPRHYIKELDDFL